MSQRSDSKFCCDSHKTLASNERRRQKDEQERLADERRRQLRINQQKAATATTFKPTQPIPKAIQEPSADLMKGFEKSMLDMLEKSAQYMKLRDQKREMDDFANKFVEITKRMQNCTEDGFIRYSDISDLEFRVSRILDDPKLCSMQVFEEHIEFVEQTLTPYLEDLRIELRESRARRLEFNPPEEITDGLVILTSPIKVFTSQ